MKVMRKCLSLLLVLCLFMSFVPVNVFATETDTTGTDVVTNGESENTASETTVATEESVAQISEDTGTTTAGLGEIYVAAPDTSSDPMYKVLHIDAARKYLSVNALRTVIQQAKENGMNQVNLYLSDNQGLRFAPVNDAKDFVVEANGTTYDLSGILGAYDYKVESADGSKHTDGKSNWITASEMAGLIDYAELIGIQLVPCINMPCHMATILQNYTKDNAETADINEQFCKTFYVNGDTSKPWLSQDSLDTSNPAAVNFALALLDMYCTYFQQQGIKYFCIAADEYGQDMYFAKEQGWNNSGFGTAHLNNDEYDKFVEFMNRAANVIKGHSMVPRAFNDPFYSDNHDNAEYDKDYQIYYWGTGWGGMKNASPAKLVEEGHKVINANSDYYYICCAATRPVLSYKDTVAAIEASPFDLYTFAGVGKVNFEPAGAAYLIWCDKCDGTNHEADITGNAMTVFAAWADCLTPDTTVTPAPTPEENTITGTTDNGAEITVTGDGLSSVTVTDVTTSVGGYVASQMSSTDYKVYTVETTTTQGDTSASYTISIKLPAGWTSVKGYVVGASAARSLNLPVTELSGSVNGGNYVFTTSGSSGTYVIENTSAASSTTTVVTLDIGDTYDFDGKVFNGDSAEVVGGSYDGLFTITADVNAGESAGFINPPTDDTAYLISDGEGHYLTITNGALVSTDDPAGAVTWTVDVQTDGTYTFSNDGNYLTVDENNALALTTNPSGATSGGGTSDEDVDYSSVIEWDVYDASKQNFQNFNVNDLVHFDGNVYKCLQTCYNYSGTPVSDSAKHMWRLIGPYAPGSGDGTGSETPTTPLTAYWTNDNGSYYITRSSTNYYLDYSNSWTASTTVTAKGAPYKTGTATTSTLELTAAMAGTYDLTIDGHTYKITILSGVTTGSCAHGITVSGRGVNSVVCLDATVTAITGYEEYAKNIYAHTLTPQIVATNDDGTITTTTYPTEVEVKVPLTDATGLASWATSGDRIKAFYVSGESTVVVDAAITTEDGTTYVTYTTPGGQVTSGLFTLGPDYFTSEVTIEVGDSDDTKSVEIPGAYDASDVYYVPTENETAAEAQARIEALFGTSVEVTTEYSPYVPPVYASAAETNKKYYVSDGNGHYLKFDSTATNNMGYTVNVEEATLFTASFESSGIQLRFTDSSGKTYMVRYESDKNPQCFSIGDSAGSYYSPSETVADGIFKGDSYLYFDGDSWETGTSASTGKAVLYTEDVPEVEAESTITFTGKTVGTASIIIGSTKYNVVVKDKAIVNSVFQIPFMITNNMVNTAGEGEADSYFLTVIAQEENYPGITSTEGIDLRSYIPTTGMRDDDEMEFMRLTWLPFESHQHSADEKYNHATTCDSSDSAPCGNTESKFNAPGRVEFERLRWNTEYKRWEFYLDVELDKWYKGEAWGPQIVDENGEPVLDEDGKPTYQTEGWYPVNPTEAEIAEFGMRGDSIKPGKGQIVAYYIQPTKVTDEVDTSVVDWGPMIDAQQNINYGSQYVLLDFAVRYEDNTRKPGLAAYPDRNKTMGFHCTNGQPDVSADGLTRTINGIMADGAPNGYEIYMITVMDNAGSLSKENSSQNETYSYDETTEKAIWLKDENTTYDTNSIGVHENLAYGTETNGIPYVASIDIQEQHAVLVTYYVRYVSVTEDSLYVHYIDRSRNDTEFYQYAIRVKNVGDEEVLFDENFGREEGTEFGLINNTVTNYYDVTQTVQGKPADVNGMPTFYRTVELELVEVKRGEDGKDVYLYYNVTGTSKDIVVDFGQPVEITAAALGESLSGLYPTNVTQYTDGYLRVHAKYGDFFVTGSIKDGAITTTDRTFYVPTAVMRGIDSAMITGTDQSGADLNQYALNVYPATSVFYEEYFAELSGSWSNYIRLPSIDRYNIATSNNIYQQTATPGMDDANNYGYDGLYIRDLSNTNTNVAAAAGSAVSTTSASATAYFDFTGDGFELYANCTPTTGTVMVVLYKVTRNAITGENENETLKSIYIVDTRRQDGGKAPTQNQAEGESINTPIVSVRDLEHGDYRVGVALTNYTNPAEETEDETDVYHGFIFDGFRVFNTLIDDTTETNVYANDGEKDPEFVEIRDSVLFVELPSVKQVVSSSMYANQIAEDVASQVYELDENHRVEAVLMSSDDDGSIVNGDAVVKDYLENGPKNEVYIKNGETLTITLPGKATASDTQIGIKTLTGTARLGETTVSQTNMYYIADLVGDIASVDDTNESTITIINNTGVIISVTDLKIPGGLPAETSGASVWSRARTFTNTLMMMGYPAAAEEPAVNNGIVEEDGVKYYFVDGVKIYAGLIEIDGDYYYVKTSGEVVCNQTYWITKTNDLMPAGSYTFDEDGKMIDPAISDSEQTDGIVDIGGKKYYCVDGVITYAGLIKIDGNYYYVKTSGEVVCDQTYWISKTNDLLPAGSYTFDAEGKMIDPPTIDENADGIVEQDGKKYYYVDGVVTYAGLIEIDGDYYYVRTSGEVVCNETYWISKTNGLLPSGSYTFDADGKMIDPPTAEDESVDGIVEKNGKKYYYVNGVITYAGLIKIDGDYYYVRTSGEVVCGQTYWISKTNDLLPARSYTFDEDGKMIDPPTVDESVDGIVEKDGKKYYYVDGVITYAGLIMIDGDYYYVRTSGEVVCGQTYWITKTNGLMEAGNYTFDADGKMVQ